MHKKQYLFESGVLESGNRKLTQDTLLKYDKKYHSEYLRQYRKNHKRVEIYFPQKDYLAIQKLASNYEKKVPTFIKEVLQEYRGKLTLIPHPSSISKVIIEIKKIGNLINQTLRYAHCRNNFSLSDFYSLHEQLSKLEIFIFNELTNSKDLKEFTSSLSLLSRSTVTKISSILKELNNQ